MSSEGTSPDSSVGIDRSRRQFIAAAGAAGALGLAGCQGGSTGGEAAVSCEPDPMTGPFSSLGPGQRTGAELAVTEINNNDDYDFEFELVTGDTDPRPALHSLRHSASFRKTGRSSYSARLSSVALALNEFAAEEEIIYNPGGAAVPITGSNCNEWVFRAETNTAQMAEASRLSAENLGTNVCYYADYAYGDSVYSAHEQASGACRRRLTRGRDIDVGAGCRTTLGARISNPTLTWSYWG
ncbi:hypothetical protein C9J85_19250 [Haloferax sp. wsp5]|nr:hypothetical protein C9J85_19250 [Haloferax sp. wsp5]